MIKRLTCDDYFTIFPDKDGELVEYEDYLQLKTVLQQIEELSDDPEVLKLIREAIGVC